MLPGRPGDTWGPEFNTIESRRFKACLVTLPLLPVVVLFLMREVLPALTDFGALAFFACVLAHLVGTLAVGKIESVPSALRLLMAILYVPAMAGTQFGLYLCLDQLWIAVA